MSQNEIKMTCDVCKKDKPCSEFLVLASRHRATILTMCVECFNEMRQVYNQFMKSKAEKESTESTESTESK